jgi:putative MATE family efflux protein
MFIVFLSLIILTLFGDKIIINFLTDKNKVFDELSFIEAKRYLKIILFCIPLNGISVLLSSTFREIGEVKVPMFAGIIAIFVNIFFNYTLMFGHFGFPELGVQGAALGTIIARLVEISILLFISFKNKLVFVDGLFNKIKVNFELFKNISKKTLPMISNELLWSVGTTMFVFLYGKRGTDIMQAYNISNTTANIFYTVFGAMAIGIQILVGQKLGENKIEEAKENAYKLQFLGIIISLLFGVILFVISPYIMYIYNSSPYIEGLAVDFMRVVAFLIFIYSFNASCYFTLRAGGKTLVTFFFDSVYMWVVAVPLAFIMIYFTELNILTVFIIIQLPDLIKSLIGFFLVKSGFWANNLTLKNKEITNE